MGSPYDPQGPGQSPSPEPSPSDTQPEPDYTQQSTFAQLPSQEIAPQTYSDPSWNAPPTPDDTQSSDAEQPVRGQGRQADYGTEAAVGGDLPSSAKAVARRMTEAGYGPEHIAGVLGALQQESGLDNGRVGDGGTSFGIAQWHASRATGLAQFAQDRNLDPYDADTQAQYMVSELAGPAYSAGQHLRDQTGVAGAAHVWRAEFERPAQSYDDAAAAAGSRFLPSVQAYVKSLRDGSADQQAAQDGTLNGTADGTGGVRGDGTTLDPVSRMSGLMGGNSTTAAPFIKAGGGTLDPRKDNWCAAFANSALAQSGIRGSNSNVATSFMTWGTGVDANDVERNDVVCVPRGHAPGELGGHVGLATGGLRDAGGVPEVEVISGNTQHGHVAIGWYPANEVVIRRSGTADTGAQDPQSAGPNVQPLIRRTGAGPTFQSNGLTLPDLDHGGTLPHGDGAPMDPSDAASFAAQNKDEGFSDLLHNFGGALTDTASDFGKDLYGAGPISHAINAAGSYLGVPMGWLTDPNAAKAIGLGGGRAEAKRAVATIDQFNDAADRAMGYDPNAPKGFMSQLGYGMGLVASMFGPSALGDVGAATRAGGLAKGALELAKKADKTALGGLTLTEGPEMAKDFTGSQTVGEGTAIGLAALMGLRVPALEKLAPTMFNILGGVGKYAKNLAGHGLEDADAVGALTPSQLQEAWRGSLIDAGNQNFQRAELETGLAGNPRAFVDQGNPDANLTQGSDLMAEAIRRTYADVARPMERALWNQVDKGVMRDYSGANDTYASELAKFQADQASFGRPATDFPSGVLNGVFRDASPNRLVSTGVLGPDGAPVMRAVSGTGRPGLGTVNNLGSGIEARGQLEDAIRGLQANPGVPGARSQIGILQRISSSLMKDMSDMNAGAGEDPAKVAAFNNARTFSAALNEIRRDPGIAAVLDRGLANGKDAVDPVLAARQFLKSGPDGVAGLRQIQNLVTKTQGDPNNILGLYKDMARSQFAKAAITDGVTNVQAATKFQKTYGQVLDQLPDVKADIQNAIASETGARQLLGKIKAVPYPDPTGAAARKAAAENWLASPIDATLKSFDGQPANVQRTMTRNVVARASQDATGKAFRGFRQELVGRMLEGSDTQGAQAVLSRWAAGHQGVIDEMSAGADPTFRTRVEALSNVNTKAGIGAAASDIIQRILGTHLGAAINHLVPGGGMAGGLSMGAGGTQIVRRAFTALKPGSKLDIARTLLENPDAFRAFMESNGMSLKGTVTDLKKQLNATSLLASYLQNGATPAAIALQHEVNQWKRENGDPNAPPAGQVGWQPGPAAQAIPAPQPVPNPQPRPMLIQA